MEIASKRRKMWDLDLEEAIYTIYTTLHIYKNNKKLVLLFCIEGEIREREKSITFMLIRKFFFNFSAKSIYISRRHKLIYIRSTIRQWQASRQQHARVSTNKI